MEFKYDGYSRKSGVYRITNKISGKVYIGSAKRFKERWTQHARSLEKGKHKNKHLQAAFNKDGTNAFVFDVLRVVEGSQADRLNVEQEFLNTLLGNWELCYNFKKNTVAEERSCWSLTPEESSAKMSSRMSGEGNPMFGKAKELSPVYGSKQTEETRLRRSQAAKIRGNNRTGTKHSDATKEKMRQKHLGKKLTDEHKKKLSEAHKGPEYLAKYRSSRYPDRMGTIK